MDKPSFGGEEAGCFRLQASKIVVLPVPFDATSTWQKGADKGPGAIIEASPHLEFYDIETKGEVYQQGIYTDNPIEAETSEEMVEAVYQVIRKHLIQERFVVTIGGEHSVSIGAIKAHVEQFGNISVLQLDAHADLREEYQGSPLNHACVMARVGELCPMVQVGIRSMDAIEARSERFHKENVFFAHEIHDSRDWIETAVSLLNEKVYVTIDLDVFDPGIMPSTGTPEPGGMGWYQVLELLKTVSEYCEIIGFDVVELCPSENRAPDFMAAKLIYKLLSYIWR